MTSNGRDNAWVNEPTNAELDARWREFCHDHRDFDYPWGRAVLHQLAEFLPYVFDGVPFGLREFYEQSGVPSNLLENWTPSGPDDPSNEWTNADEWLPSAVLRQLPIFRLDLALRAYAYYGIKLVQEPLELGLDEFLEDWDSKLGSLFPRDWCGEEQKKTIMAALARRKLDEPKHGDTITPEELAALAGVDRKSIMNLLAPSNRALRKVEANGELTIDIESARSWLRARSNFRPSVWQYQDDSVTGQPLQSKALQLTDVIFVPVASDSVWFSPEHRTQRKDRLRQRGKPRSERSLYFVANGDHEEKHDNYWEALDFLTRAELPRWRYSDGGQWHTKNVKGWLRKPRREVEALLNVGGNGVASTS
jgi:hypothetical protein